MSLGYLSRRAGRLLLLLAAAVLVAALWYVFLVAPIERDMGIIQKIFYFHVPSAYAMYLGALACLGGSVAYLWRPSDVRDAVARAGGEVAVVFGAIVLVTGPIWATKAWGTPWTWDPRLTTLLLSVFLYMAYLVLRQFGGGGEAERKFAAALGVLAAVNLPIIHFAVRKWSGQHPEVITGRGGGLQHPDMKTAFVISMVAFTLLAALLIWQRARLAASEARLERVERRAMALPVWDK